MSEIRLGEIITSEQHRDAIHVAVAPVEASETLYPGRHVSVANGVASIKGKAVGIVDPFLRGPVHPAQKFWVFLYPQTITGMRHHWKHPAFEDEPTQFVEAAKEWIAEYAGREHGLDYDEIMLAAEEYLSCGEYLIQGGRWEGYYTSDEFWDHFEIVTGRKVSADDRGSFFSCSC